MRRNTENKPGNFNGQYGSKYQGFPVKFFQLFHSKVLGEDYLLSIKSQVR